jgi:hypothetical protein
MNIFSARAQAELWIQQYRIKTFMYPSLQPSLLKMSKNVLSKAENCLFIYKFADESLGGTTMFLGFQNFYAGNIECF